MKKLKLKIDIDKMDKSRIKTREYTDREGVTKTVREYEIDLVPAKEEKIVGSTDKWDIVKVGFASESAPKNEDGSYPKTPILGDLIEFRERKQMGDMDAFMAQRNEQMKRINEAEGEVNPNDIPF